MYQTKKFPQLVTDLFILLLKTIQKSTRIGTTYLCRRFVHKFCLYCQLYIICSTRGLLFNVSSRLLYSVITFSLYLFCSQIMNIDCIILKSLVTVYHFSPIKIKQFFTVFILIITPVYRHVTLCFIFLILLINYSICKILLYQCI